MRPLKSHFIKSIKLSYILMNYRYFTLFLFTTIFGFAQAPATGGLALEPPILKEVNGKTVVTLKVENTMQSAVTGARAWVFLMDAKGKVLANQSQWIIAAGDDDALPAGESHDYVVSMQATGATQAKVVFSRIVLADGTVKVIKQ